jgi:CelD/BcsL family acetyltransferase involved in cellulose biosynthesis
VSSNTVNGLRTIGQMAEQWEDLADEVGASPFLRPGWIGAWWDAFGRGTLRIVAVGEGGRLGALAPLRVRWGALDSPTNWHTPLFGPLARDADCAQALARRIFSQGPHHVTLSFVDRQDLGVTAFRDAAAAAGFHLVERTILRSPYVAIDGDWPQYQRRLGSKRLSNLRRLRRRLEEQGDLSFEVLDGSDRLDQLLDDGLAVEASGWRGTQGTAIQSQPDTARFYRQVARWAATRGSLRIAFLRLSGRPLAFDYCLEEAGVHYLIKTGYDQAYLRFAPGVLLRQEMVERAFSIGLRTYEFLGADDPWKAEWADRSRERRRVQAFAPSAVGFAERAGAVYGRPLAKRTLRLIRR